MLDKMKFKISIFLMLAIFSLKGIAISNDFMQVNQSVIQIQNELSNNKLGYYGLEKNILKLKAIQKNLTEYEPLITKKINQNKYLKKIIEQNPNKSKYEKNHQDLIAELSALEQEEIASSILSHTVTNLLIKASYLQKKINAEVKIYPSLLTLLESKNIYSEHIIIKPFQQVLNLNTLSSVQKSLLWKMTLAALIFGFMLRSVINHFIQNHRNSSWMKELYFLKTLDIIKHYLVFLLPLFTFNSYLEHTSIDLNSSGGIENLSKTILEYTLLHCVFTCYIFDTFKLNEDGWAQKIWKNFNIAFFIIILNSGLIWFEQNFIVPGNLCSLFEKIHGILTATLFPFLWRNFICTCTQTTYYPPTKHNRVLTIRYLILIPVYLVYVGKFILLLAFSSTDINGGVTKKILLMLMILIIYEAIIGILHFVVDRIQHHRLKVGRQNLQRLMGVPGHIKIFEFTLLKGALFGYLLINTLVPVCIYFLDLPKFYLDKYRILIYDGLNLSTSNGLIFNFFPALISYCSIVLVGKVVINKLVKHPSLSHNIHKKHNTILVLNYLNKIIAIVLGLKIYGIDLHNIVIILGGLSVGIGIGLNVFFGDLIAGIIILAQKTLRVHDYVTININPIANGHVRQIRLLNTEIITNDNKILNIANSIILKSTFINHTIDNESTSKLMIFKLETPHDGKKAIELAERLLKKHQGIMNDSVAGPHLDLKIIPDENYNSKNFLSIAINVKKINDKALVVSEIYDSICKLLKKNGIKLVNKNKDDSPLAKKV